MSSSDDKGSDETVERLEMKLAFQFIKCPFFARKVRGVNDLKEILDRTINSENKKARSASYDPRSRSTKWINYDRFIDFMTENKVLEEIMYPKGNQEIIKRSELFFKVLAYK